MLKKVLVGLLALVVVGSIGLFLWARAVFTQDSVRTALAEQLSRSLGQPVTVGGISASIYPRVTVNLTDVAIGEPARIQVEALDVGTDFRALLSRRIEHAALRLTGARIDLPLPPFRVTSSTPPSGSDPGSSSVEIVSIDEIALSDVAIASGGRTVRGNIEVVPQGKSLTVRRMTLDADNTTIEITGQINDLSGPAGELSIKAGALNVNELLAFVSDFAGSAGIGVSGDVPTAPAPPSGAAGGPPSAMNLILSIDADSAAMGGLSLQKLSGRARITPQGMALDPIRFGLFGGSYDGTLMLTLAEIPAFRLNAALSGVDMGAVTRFAGSPDTITGRLAGKVELSGSGMDAASVLRSARGTARVDITNGTVKRLGLVRTVLVATSGRSGAQTASEVSSDESFARLAAALAVANGSASTMDLRFESDDLLLAAAGVVRLDGTAVNLAGNVQLSDKLSAQVGRDLVRYTQEQGRVTLPVTISGSADNLQVRIDVASVGRRALINRAKEEVQGIIKKGLGGLFGR